MHANEITIDDALARALIAESFPELTGTELRRIRTTGTVNTIIRVGDDLVARFPLLPATRAELEGEAEALTEFTGACPFPTPVPYGVGSGSDAFPSFWSLQTWVPGGTAHFDSHADSAPLAQDLAEMIQSLRAVEPGDRVFDGRGAWRKSRGSRRMGDGMSGAEPPPARRAPGDQALGCAARARALGSRRDEPS